MKHFKPHHKLQHSSQPVMAAYSTDELISVYNMIEIIGGALGDTFTSICDSRPLARFADTISGLLGEMERLIIVEMNRRETPPESKEPNRPVSGSATLPVPDYSFSYSTARQQQR